MLGQTTQPVFRPAVLCRQKNFVKRSHWPAQDRHLLPKIRPENGLELGGSKLVKSHASFGGAKIPMQPFCRLFKCTPNLGVPLGQVNPVVFLKTPGIFLAIQMVD
jgi:hypothetical protein